MLLCYIFAFIISAPLGFLKNVDSFINTTNGSDERIIYTSPENKIITGEITWKIYIYVEESIIRFGPAIILAALNFLIIVRFRQITNRKAGLLNASGESGGVGNGMSEGPLLRGERISRRLYNEEKRLVILLTAIVVLFFITILPSSFLSIFYTEDDCTSNTYGFQIFRAIANTLELCNFALNFYIYFLCSKEFRKKFLSFFAILQPKKSKANIQSITLENLTHKKVVSSKSRGNEV